MAWELCRHTMRQDNRVDNGHPLSKWLICGVGVVSEGFRDRVNGDGSQVAYVIANGNLKLRQDYTEFGLTLGSNGLGAEYTNPIF